MNWGVVVVAAGALIIAAQTYLLVANGIMLKSLKERFPTQPTAVVAGIVSVCAASRFLGGECASFTFYFPFLLTISLLLDSLVEKELL